MVNDNESHIENWMQNSNPRPQEDWTVVLQMLTVILSRSWDCR
jgi:hypothetical protein